MVGPHTGNAGDKWRRRLRAARIEAALTNIGAAALTGATGILTVSCFVGEARGWLNPGTWEIVLVLGSAVILVKACFDFRDRSNEGALWRSILIREFGDDMRSDREAARLAKLAIEFRVRLSTAVANSNQGAAIVATLLPRVDDWLDLIVGLARKVASLRTEAQFQATLAARSKARLSQIETQARVSTDQAHVSLLAETQRALSTQVEAFDKFNRYVEDGYLRLEHAVGAFTAACSQLVLEMSREGDQRLQTQIGVEIAEETVATEKVLAYIGRLVVPDLPEVTNVIPSPVKPTD